MKQILVISLVIITVTAAVSRVYAFNNAAEHKTAIIQLGVGYDLHGRHYDIVVPPIHVVFDFCVRVHEKAPLSFGVVFAYARSEYRGWTITPFNFLAFGFRAAYHFTDFIKVDNLDLYAGIVLGGVAIVGTSSRFYTINKQLKIIESHPRDSYFMGGVYGGVRYYFVDHVGVFAEVGYGISYISGGICFKF